MSGSHFVNTCKIDVEYNQEEKARTLQAKVSQIFHSALTSTILETLDGFNTTDATLSIDRLEIDLGEIEEEKLQHEFPKRLKEKLKEALANTSSIQANAANATAIAKSYTDQERYILALEEFLRSGSIAWQYRNITASFNGFIEKILYEYPAALARLIRKHSTNQVFLERLVKQFGADNMHRVIRILAPNEAEVVIETVAKIQWLEVKEKILSVPQAAFENSIWELALLYLVRDRGTYFNNKDFIKSVIKGMAARYNVDFISYLRQLHRAVQYLTQHHTFKYAFPQLLEELYRESVLHDDAFLLHPSRKERELALNFYLEHGYLNADHAFLSKADLEFVWGKYTHTPTLKHITTFLQKHINHPAVRFRTISLIREEGSKKVVEYVEPAHSQFIFEFADKLQREQEEGIFNITTDSKTFSLLKWDFVIYTLLNNRGSVFNTKVFILGTIQAMANRYGQRFENLLGLIVRNIPAKAFATPGSNLAAALQLIKNEYNIPNKNDGNEGSPSLKLKTLMLLLSGKTKLTRPKKNELASLIADLYASADKHVITLLEKALSEGALPLEKMAEDPELAKKIGSISPALHKAIDAGKAHLKKHVVEAGLLTKDIEAAIQRLLEGQEKQRKNLSHQLYHLLLGLFSKPSATISKTLQQLFLSDQFISRLVLTQTEASVLHTIAPEWFVAVLNRMAQHRAAHASEAYSDQVNENATISLLRHYAVHTAFPWWAAVVLEKNHTLDQLVATLLKAASAAVKEQLAVLLADKKKRSVILQSLAHTTIATLAKQLGNIPDKNLKYYLNLVEQVNNVQPFTQHKNTSLRHHQWDMIFETLLADRGTGFNLKTFLRSSLKKLAVHFNIPYGTMLRSIQQLINRSSGEGKNTFKKILTELAIESGNEQEQNATKKNEKEHTDEIDHEVAYSSHASYWQPLLSLLQKINSAAFKPGNLHEIEELLLQADGAQSAALLQLLKSLNWPEHEWQQRWSLIKDTMLARLCETLTADMLFVKSYFTDWEKFMSHYGIRSATAARRRFYELTLLYLITHPTAEKHAWFAFVLSGYASSAAKRADLIQAMNSYFETESNLVLSTLQLSFQKWKSAPAGKKLKSAPAEKTIKQKQQEKQQPETKANTAEPALTEEDTTQDQWVQNCGLVLLWPFLERYFSLLGLLEERKFKSPEAAYRAVHLLQYLASGAEGYPEYHMVLNKVLCGVKVAKPIVKDLVLTAKEKELSEDMLKGVIRNWSILGNTSAEGLRATFLMREGLLKKKTDWDQLHVERKAFDVLIDRIPWSYAIVKLPWMERAIHVVWK